MPRSLGFTVLLGCCSLASCSDSGSEAGNGGGASTEDTSTAVGGGPTGSPDGTTTASSSQGGLGTAASAAASTTASSGAFGGTTNSTDAAGGAAQSASVTTSSSTGGAAGVTSAESSTGSGGSGGTGSELDPDALVVAPEGTPGAPGTIEDPTTLPDALERADAGTTIYLRGGTYTFDTTLDLAAEGSASAPIRIGAYPLDGARPLLDFSAMAEDSSNRGLSLSGDYWHVYGIDVFGAGDNGMFVSGSHNIIEHSTFAQCADTGLQLGNGASDNLVLNCDSYFNADSSLENADGFAAKLDVGTGNRFVGCRA
ncbi:MAG TPA: hypothetical protein VFU02_11410, partial [Polyangiaceae bacterium]|nr:hypothetical protein [Polyangiaceae bacterium]